MEKYRCHLPLSAMSAPDIASPVRRSIPKQVGVLVLPEAFVAEQRPEGDVGERFGVTNHLQAGNDETHHCIACLM